MKNLLFMIAFLIGIVSINAQTVVTEVTPDGYITEPSYVYIFGSTSDTLTNGDTTTYVMRVQGLDALDFNIKAYVDRVSGTAGGTVILSQSIDGVTYQSELGDTITLSGIVADVMDTETISKSGFNYPYFKIEWIQTGTTVTVPKLFIYGKKD